jgi:hypothetical protein
MVLLVHRHTHIDPFFKFLYPEGELLDHMVIRSLIFLMFLLVYCSCTGGFIVTFPYMLTVYPGLVHFLNCSLPLRPS